MKILSITTIRSDYDLMSNLYKLLDNDDNIELKLLVAGAHMSSTYGKSVDLIRKDGFEVLSTLETLIDSNSKQSRLKTGALLLINSIDIIAFYQPDLIIYAGDREDALVGAMLGGYLQIPTIHFFGGDHVKDGHIDNPVRHAISKLSSIHFVSIENHKKRLVKMGEDPKRIFTIGAVSLDKFMNHKSLSRNQIKEYFNIKKGFNEHAILIFHPLDTELKYSAKIFENILKVLKNKKINTFVSYPNTDPGNKDIIKILEEYKKEENFIFYKNLDRELFLSIYKTSILQIGNSSSGIVESASIHIPVVNVGSRQIGREQSGNVIFCGINKKDIENAILNAMSPQFRKKVKNIQNIYGDGKSSEIAHDLIKKIDFSSFLYKTEDPLLDNNFMSK